MIQTHIKLPVPYGKGYVVDSTFQASESSPAVDIMCLVTHPLTIGQREKLVDRAKEMTRQTGVYELVARLSAAKHFYELYRAEHPDGVSSQPEFKSLLDIERMAIWHDESWACYFKVTANLFKGKRILVSFPSGQSAFAAIK